MITNLLKAQQLGQSSPSIKNKNGIIMLDQAS